MCLVQLFGSYCLSCLCLVPLVWFSSCAVFTRPSDPFRDKRATEGPFTPSRRQPGATSFMVRSLAVTSWGCDRVVPSALGIFAASTVTAIATFSWTPNVVVVKPHATVVGDYLEHRERGCATRRFGDTHTWRRAMPWRLDCEVCRGCYGCESLTSVSWESAHRPADSFPERGLEAWHGSAPHCLRLAVESTNIMTRN